MKTKHADALEFINCISHELSVLVQKLSNSFLIPEAITKSTWSGFPLFLWIIFFKKVCPFQKQNDLLLCCESLVKIKKRRYSCKLLQKTNCNSKGKQSRSIASRPFMLEVGCQSQRKRQAGLKITFQIPNNYQASIRIICFLSKFWSLFDFCRSISHFVFLWFADQCQFSLFRNFSKTQFLLIGKGPGCPEPCVEIFVFDHSLLHFCSFFFPQVNVSFFGPATTSKGVFRTLFGTPQTSFWDVNVWQLSVNVLTLSKFTMKYSGYFSTSKITTWEPLQWKHTQKDEQTKPIFARRAL